MIAKDLISDVVPALCTTDTGEKALSWMEIFRISHLPIIHEDEFLGVISENDIYDYNIADHQLKEYKLSLFRPYIYDYQHIYEIIEIVSRLKLTIVPVLDAKNKYLGIITLNDLVSYFANLMAVNTPGAVITLEMNANDYSLTEIANIVESNNAKILSCYVKPIELTTLIEVTLKLNTDNITAIVQTLNRYEYIIKASYMEDESYQRILEERYETFMNYLNI